MCCIQEPYYKETKTQGLIDKNCICSFFAVRAPRPSLLLLTSPLCPLAWQTCIAEVKWVWDGDDWGQDEAGHRDHDETLPSRADVATGETQARLSIRVTAPCLGANNNLTITNLSPCLPGQLIQTEHPINVDRLKLISSTLHYCCI